MSLPRREGAIQDPLFEDVRDAVAQSRLAEVGERQLLAPVSVDRKADLLIDPVRGSSFVC